MQGEMKLQIDRMIAKFFSSLPVDEQLNFSVAVTVMSVQRKWRQRMKAHKVSQSGLLLPRVFFSRVDPVHIQVQGSHCMPSISASVHMLQTYQYAVPSPHTPTLPSPPES